MARQDRTLQLWKWDGSAAAPGQGDLPVPIHALEFSPDGQRLLSLLANGTTQARDAQGNPISQPPRLLAQSFSTVTPPDPPSPAVPLPAFLQTLPPWALGAIAAAIVLVLFLLGWLTRRRSTAQKPAPAEPTEATASPVPATEGQADQASSHPAVYGNDADISFGSRLGDAERDMEYALAMAKEGQFDEALNHVQRAIEVADLERIKALAAGVGTAGVVALLAQGLARRGGVLGLLGRSDDAVDNFDRALDLNPDSIDAWVGKGQLLLEQQHPEAALDCFEAALERDPDLPMALAGKGQALQQLGRSQEAQPLLDQAAANGVEHVNLLQALDPGSVGQRAALGVGAGAAALTALKTALF
ncbi:tetratricopeptide repeat protein [Halomicronema hongdechloris]|uniref:tetratricopeptide repeat protein n=1 Tax=Halomicronema hongdechloris TaxID=1209493 RepID=UPI0016511E18|nr:tetratricopeptide repeat protein [Halomicronema hongdechloris]